MHDRPTRDRYRGALLGTALGDALGMPVEGMDRRTISDVHGTVRDMLPARLGAGTVTDDTHLALALAEALAETPGRIDPDVVARRFAERFDPRRGYGANTRRILERIGRGEPWRIVVEEERLPGGSWANGAAMRAAPVALGFPGDPAKVLEAAAIQASVTGHDHPVGRDGARLQALATLLALNADGPPEPRAFVGRLLDVSGGWHAEIESALGWIARTPDAAPDEAAEALGTGGRASQSVPAALWSFLHARGGAEETVIRAVNLGGDTDTIGAMAGALAGALRGASAFPARWADALETGPEGAEAVLRAADALHTGTGTRPQPRLGP